MRDRILETACDLFYRHGIRAVGVDAIASEAGTNKMSFYRSFPSKDDLVAEYLRDQEGEYWKWWDEVVAPYAGNPRRQVEALIDSIVDLARHKMKEASFRAAARILLPPILRTQAIDAPVPIRIDGPSGAIECVPIPQLHGDIGTLGFRVGGLAYSPDISDIPVASLPLLQNLDVWIVDALRFTPHPSHFSVKQALAWIKRLAPKRAILTHITTDLDYEALRRELPAESSPPTTTWSSTSIELRVPVIPAEGAERPRSRDPGFPSFEFDPGGYRARPG